jgi:glycosyltransferase involved in cell wall biosynthesis
VRVVFCIHELALNGAVTSLLQQVRRLRARGDHVAVMVPPLSGAAAALEQEFRATGAELVSQVPLAEFDVAVGCTVFAAKVLEQMAGRIPTVWWIHEGRAGVNIISNSPEGMRALARVNKLIFASRGVVERLWSGLLGNLPPGRIDIVPYLVPPPAPGEAIEKRAGFARVLCVGTIYPRKRQIDLIRAVSALRGASVECVLIGERVALDPGAEEIIRATPDRFTLTGGLHPDEVQRWYRSADVVCLPSADECMPISLVEAAWHGIPIVIADLECYQGVWKHGVNALIHPIGDWEMLGWYLQMLNASSGLRGRLTSAARTIAQQFTDPRVGALFDAALLDAIAAHSPRSLQVQSG